MGTASLLQPQDTSIVSALHEFHENCHSVTFYLMKKDSKRCCDTSMPESIHTTEESKRGTAFAFIYGNGMTSFMEFMLSEGHVSHTIQLVSDWIKGHALQKNCCAVFGQSKAFRDIQFTFLFILTLAYHLSICISFIILKYNI